MHIRNLQANLIFTCISYFSDFPLKSIISTFQYNAPLPLSWPRRDLNSNLVLRCIRAPTAISEQPELYQNEPVDRRPCANTTPMPCGTCPNNVLINQMRRSPPFRYHHLYEANRSAGAYSETFVTA